MTRDDNAAMNKWLRNGGRIVETTPDTASPPEPVQYAAGSADGGESGAPPPPDPHKRLNDELRAAMERLKGRI